MDQSKNHRCKICNQCGQTYIWCQCSNKNTANINNISMYNNLIKIQKYYHGLDKVDKTLFKNNIIKFIN